MKKGRKKAAQEKVGVFDPLIMQGGKNIAALNFARKIFMVGRKPLPDEPGIPRAAYYAALPGDICATLKEVTEKGDGDAATFLKAVAKEIEAGHHRLAAIDMPRILLRNLTKAGGPFNATHVAAEISAYGYPVGEKWVRNGLRELGRKTIGKGRP